MHRGSGRYHNPSQHAPASFRPQVSKVHVRQEDDQPNLGEHGSNLRPANYVIGRREPEPEPPRVMPSKRGGYQASYRGKAARGKARGKARDSYFPTRDRYPGQVPSGVRYQPHHASSNQMTWRRDPGDIKAATAPSDPPTSITPKQPQERIDGNEKQNMSNLSFALEQSGFSDSAPDSNANSSNAVPASATQGRVHVSEDEHVWRSPSRPSSVSQKKVVQSIPSSSDLLASVQPLVVQDSSSQDSRRASELLKVQSLASTTDTDLSGSNEASGSAYGVSVESSAIYSSIRDLPISSQTRFTPRSVKYSAKFNAAKQNEGSREATTVATSKGKERARDSDVISIQSTSDGDGEDTGHNIEANHQRPPGESTFDGQRMEMTGCDTFKGKGKSRGEDEDFVEASLRVASYVPSELSVPVGVASRSSNTMRKNLTEAEKKELRGKERKHVPGSRKGESKDPMAQPRTWQVAAELAPTESTLDQSTDLSRIPPKYLPKTPDSTQPAKQVMTSVVDLPPECQVSHAQTPSQKVKALRTIFARAQYDMFEAQLGRPVYPVDDGEFYSQASVRFIYECPALEPNQIAIVLPDNCRRAHPSYESHREQFKIEQIVAQTLKGNIPKQITFSSALLIITFTSSQTPSRPPVIPAQMEADLNDVDQLKSFNRLSETIAIEDNASGKIKREASISPAPHSVATIPPVPSGIESRLRFPRNITASYADSPHTKSHVENFLNL